MKRPMKTALWCDCETDEERAEFFRSGRAWLAGNTMLLVCEPIADAFEDAAKWRRHAHIINQAIDTAIISGKYTITDAPPWGPDAVPLMVCEDAEESSDCKRCCRSTPHVCDYFCKLGSCLACGVNDDACVQVGWRERSKP